MEGLLGADGVVAGKPATPEAVADVAQLYERELPRSLVDLWRAANGAALNSIDADLLSCEQSRS